MTDEPNNPPAFPEALAKLQADYDALLAHQASELGSVMAEVRDRALEEAANLMFDPQVAEAIRALKGKTDA